MSHTIQSSGVADVSKLFFVSTKFAWLWLLLRIYIGWEWLQAGYNKLVSAAWGGDHAGAAVTGFLTQALQKTGGEHPDVASWYAWFITNVALPHATLFSYVVTFGELLVGIGLILGVFTADVNHSDNIDTGMACSWLVWRGLLYLQGAHI